MEILSNMRKKEASTACLFFDAVERLLARRGSLEGFGEHRGDLEQVAADTVVGDLEDWGGLVLVDRDDALGLGHTGLVLDGTGDTERDIDLRMNGLAGLTDLMVGGEPAGVNGNTGAADNAAENVGEFFRQLDAAFDVLGDTTTDGNDEVSANEVNELLGSLDDLNDLSLHVSSFELDVILGDLNGVSLGSVKRGLLHNARTDGSHSGTEARADDGGHQVAAECRTGHLEVAGHIVILAHDLGSVHLFDLLFGERGGAAQEVLVDGH